MHHSLFLLLPSLVIFVDVEISSVVRCIQRKIQRKENTSYIQSRNKNQYNGRSMIAVHPIFGNLEYILNLKL